jgi:tetratricopeptide (TPR) repeat protein
MTFINLAINNLIHRIISNKEDAETLYQGLKNKNPQSNYVFMSEILLNDFNNIYPLEKDLPQNKLNEQDIVRTLAVCYHQAKKHEEALTWLEKCYKLSNEELEIQSIYALSLLNYVRRDEVCFGNQWSEDDKSKLVLSIRLFSDLWEQYDSKKIKKLHLSDGIGLCDAC